MKIFKNMRRKYVQKGGNDIVRVVGKGPTTIQNDNQKLKTKRVCEKMFTKTNHKKKI